MSSQYTIVGRLGNDPQFSISERGTVVVRMSVAVEHRRKKGDEWVSDTVWHDVTCFGELADNLASSVTKGDEIIATGRIEAPRSFEKKDGTTGVSLPMVATDVGFSLRWAGLTVQSNNKSNKTAEEAF